MAPPRRRVAPVWVGAMNDLGAELAAIAADLRAILDDTRGRGVLAESETPLPIALPWVSDSVSEAEAPPAVAATDPWVALAVPPPAAPPETLTAVRDDLGDCRRCGLCAERHTIVFGVGAEQAVLMVVGDGPGHDEDLGGEPFVGPAGQMLDRMLLNVLGLSRAQVYLTNVVKCRPPGNRNPRPDELAACQPFLERQILAVQPRVILVLGAVALRALTGAGQGLLKQRGHWLTWRNIEVLPTFHPDHLLRNPDEKKRAFEDLKKLKTRLDEIGRERA